MNFFKSLLSDDPDPTEPENDRESGTNSTLKAPPDDSNSTPAANAWSFGDLIKTIATQSESVIEIYRKDLQEFQSGLRKETEIFRETASRAVKDLPASLEAGASAAHGALDGVIKSTAEIISKETQAFGGGGEPETPDTIRNLSAGRYSWFSAQLRAIQSDLNTFCEVPEDEEEYGKWKLGFKLEEYKDEIDSLIGTLEGVYKRVVPGAVDHENFWSRYFYRVDKLKQQESVRANLVRRAISIDDEEELSWDVDDDDEEEEEEEQSKERDELGNNVSDQKDLNNGSQDEKKVDNINVDDDAKKNVVESSKKNSENGKKEVKSKESVEGNIEGKVSSEEKSETAENNDIKKEVAQVKVDEQMKSEERVKEKNDERVCVEEKKESIKKGDALPVSSHQLKAGEEEEDMGWDEIEDTGSGDEEKVGGSTNRHDLHKRLSAAVDDDDDDLNWDIEDDDGEPPKA